MRHHETARPKGGHGGVGAPGFSGRRAIRLGSPVGPAVDGPDRSAAPRRSRMGTPEEDGPAGIRPFAGADVVGRASEPSADFSRIVA